MPHVRGICSIQYAHHDYVIIINTDQCIYTHMKQVNFQFRSTAFVETFS